MHRGFAFQLQKSSGVTSLALLQVYASYKYPRSEIDKLRPGPTASLARKFDGTMVVSDFDQSTRRVGPFQMKPATALR